MEFQIREGAPVTVVAITGSVDRLTSESLLAALQEQITKGNARLVADFTQVDYTSSAGLRVLLATLKEARLKGGDFRLAGVRPDVHRVLDLSGFTSILKLYPDVDSAIASFG
jgi:anti-anti-sigma factor